MMRSILIYLPFMVAVQLATLYMILQAAVLYPMSKVGLAWFKVPAWILGVVVAIIIVIVLIALIYEGIKKLWGKPKPRVYVERPESDSWKVVKAYIDAKHEAICPTIVIEDDNDNKPVVAKVDEACIYGTCDCNDGVDRSELPPFADDPENQA